MGKRSLFVLLIVAIIAILFFLTYSFAISELTIQPGTSIFIKPGEYVRVTCEGDNNQFKPYCLCVQKSDLLAELYYYTSLSEKMFLRSFYSSYEGVGWKNCVSEMESLPTCNQ